MPETLESLRRDAQYALRGLRRAPAFTLAVIVSIAVGIGGTLATFRIVDRLMFQAPSGVRDPGTVRRLTVQSRSAGGRESFWSVFSMPDLLDFSAVAEPMGQVAGYATSPNLALAGQDAKATVSYVSADFFHLLGVRTRYGRLFTPEENDLSGKRAADPLVVSFDFFKRMLGADTTAIGRRIAIGAQTFTIVGVAQEDFHGIDLRYVDAWAPLAARPGTEGLRFARGAYFLELIGRATESRDWTALASRFSAQYFRGGPSERRFGSEGHIVAAPILESRGPGALFPNQAKDVSLANRLAALSIVVLVMTVVNIAVLQLMRTIRRRHEIGVRLAFGMTRRRLIGQLFIESAILAFAGGAGAVLINWWGAEALQQRLLATMRLSSTGLDERGLYIAGVLALVIACCGGIAPAMISRRFTWSSLRLQGTTDDPAGARAQSALLSAQTALCIFLIAFAGAFLQSLVRLAHVDLGFDANQLVAVDGGPGMYDVNALASSLRALPFVESVSTAESRLSDASDVRVEIALRRDAPEPAERQPSYSIVSPEFFKTTKTATVAGRIFDAHDALGSEPVIVVNDAMAKTFWPGRSPLGECIYVFKDFSRCWRVVGVVGDIRWNLTGPPMPSLYVSGTQARRGVGRSMLVRTRGAPGPAEVAQLERVGRSVIGDDGPGPRVATVVSQLDPQLAPLRAASTLFGLFGLLALFSAVAGVYGIVSYDLARRMRELGIRLALGASSRDIGALVARSGARAILIGIVIGLAAAFAGGRLIAGYLFDTPPASAPTVAVAVAMLLIAAIVASLAPVRRAVRLDPVVVLRSE